MHTFCPQFQAYRDRLSRIVTITQAIKFHAFSLAVIRNGYYLPNLIFQYLLNKLRPIVVFNLLWVFGSFYLFRKLNFEVFFSLQVHNLN